MTLTKPMLETLRPFATFCAQLERQGKNGTWLGSELDNYETEVVVHVPRSDGPPQALPDDLAIISVQVEKGVGQAMTEITMGDLRALRRLVAENSDRRDR
ncbi:hypothetical protein [Acuticoccus kandeliae]|uniref:hypothetical protein n=1 Tax=Acuticoccus kandeliae TaxID=2073160 RepID=UPI0013008C4F|nr:hypothetical protein [Acuticoccus kandeliae]